MLKMKVNVEKTAQAAQMFNNTKNNVSELLYCMNKLKNEIECDSLIQQSVEYPEIADRLFCSFDNLKLLEQKFSDMAVSLNKVTVAVSEIENEAKQNLASLNNFATGITMSACNNAAAISAANVQLQNNQSMSAVVEKAVADSLNSLEFANLVAFSIIIEDEYRLSEAVSGSLSELENE